MPAPLISTLRLLEDVLAGTAQRAAPILRDIFKGRAWCDSMIGITYGWVILILADSTDILLHWLSPLRQRNIRRDGH